MSSTLTPLSILLRLQTMFNFSWVRMVGGALKKHLHPILLSSNLIKGFFESVIVIPENVKLFLFFVNKYISLLFRVYSTDQLMTNVASTMLKARMERSNTEQQFLIPRPVEYSWGNKRVLDKENIIWKFVGKKPVMNQKKDEECMTAILDAVIVNRVQNPG